VYDPGMTVARTGYRLACGLAMTACASAIHARAPQEPPAQPPTAATTAGTANTANTAVNTTAEAPPRPCGTLDCLAFPTPQAAFEYVLRSEPRVLAVGEAHAQQGTAQIRSSTRRFAEQLLPLLSGKSKHIVIELLLANCKPHTSAQVAQTQAPVTEQQAQSNQAEFLTLGKYAKRLGIEPQALAPECAEYDSVIAARNDGVARLLSIVAEQTRKSVLALLAEPEPGLVVTYGGALHNDLYPRPGQESWSFGPALAQASLGHYVELDLIVPEFVKDSEAWRNLPWFQAFDRDHLPTETLLFRPAPGTFTLIFPKTETTSGQGL